MEDKSHGEHHHEEKLLNKYAFWRSDLGAVQLIYFTFITVTSSYCLFSIFNESIDEPDAMERRNRSLDSGWSLIGRRKDIADFEWSFWFSDLREEIVGALIGHISIGIVTRLYMPEVQDIAQSIYGAYCVYLLLGYQYIAVVTIQCVIVVLVTSYFKSRYACWTVTVISVIINHYDATINNWLVTSSLGEYPAVMSIAYSGLALTALRSCSFALEKADNLTSSRDYFDVIKYNFYLPLFFFGPIMTYDSYQSKKISNVTMHELKEVAMEIIRTVCFIIIIDCLLHFLHVTSLPDDEVFLNETSGIVLAFLMFCNVMLDWVKAYALYSIASGVAAHVDGFYGAPHAPTFMARLYTFADTYFDRGIHHWLCRYIYDPIGLNHSDWKLETMAGGASFAFVILWLGGGWTVFVWAFLNWFGLSFEFIVQLLAHKSNIKNDLFSVIFGGINYFMILAFNCVAIIGLSATKVMAGNIFYGGLWQIILVAAALYCYVAVVKSAEEKIDPEKKDE